MKDGSPHVKVFGAKKGGGAVQQIAELCAPEPDTKAWQVDIRAVQDGFELVYSTTSHAKGPRSTLWKWSSSWPHDRPPEAFAQLDYWVESILM